MIRIIDNKKINLTDSEYKAYQDICKAYDRPNFSGKDLFKDLFETDGSGNIVFLRPPHNKYVSMEVVIFLQNIMVHQHLRLMYDEIDATNKKVIEKIKEYDKKIEKIEKIEKIKEQLESESSSSSNE